MIWADVVPQACALISDLKILEDGDESEIGERGVSDFRRLFHDALRLTCMVLRSTCLEVKKLEVRELSLFL